MQSSPIALLRGLLSSAQVVDTRGVSKQKLDNIAPDRIVLRGLLFHGNHGVLPEVSNSSALMIWDENLEYCDRQL